MDPLYDEEPRAFGVGPTVDDAKEAFARMRDDQVAPQLGEDVAKTPEVPKMEPPAMDPNASPEERAGQMASTLAPQGAMPGFGTPLGEVMEAQEKMRQQAEKERIAQQERQLRESERQIEQQRSGNLRVMREAGVQMTVDDAGNTVPAVDPQGQPVFKEGWSGEPRQDESGEWVRDYRDSTGEARPVNLWENEDIHRDPETGELYLGAEHSGGVRKVVGVDENWKALRDAKARQAELAANRDLLEQDIKERSFHLQNLKTDEDLTGKKAAYDEATKKYSTFLRSVSVMNPDIPVAALEGDGDAIAAQLKNEAQAGQIKGAWGSLKRARSVYEPIARRAEEAETAIRERKEQKLRMDRSALAIAQDINRVEAQGPRPKFFATRQPDENEPPEVVAERESRGIGGAAYELPDLESEQQKLNEVLESTDQEIERLSRPLLPQAASSETQLRLQDLRKAQTDAIDRFSAKQAAVRRYNAIGRQAEKDMETVAAELKKAQSESEASMQQALLAGISGGIRDHEYLAIKQREQQKLATHAERMREVRKKAADAQARALSAIADDSPIPDAFLDPQSGIAEEFVAQRAAGRAFAFGQDERQAYVDVLEELRGKVKMVNGVPIKDAIDAAKAQVPLKLDDILTTAERDTLAMGIGNDMIELKVDLLHQGQPTGVSRTKPGVNDLIASRLLQAPDGTGEDPGPYNRPQTAEVADVVARLAQSPQLKWAVQLQLQGNDAEDLAAVAERQSLNQEQAYVLGLLRGAGATDGELRKIAKAILPVEKAPVPFAEFAAQYDGSALEAIKDYAEQFRDQTWFDSAGVREMARSAVLAEQERADIRARVAGSREFMRASRSPDYKGMDQNGRLLKFMETPEGHRIAAGELGWVEEAGNALTRLYGSMASRLAGAAAVASNLNPHEQVAAFFTGRPTATQQAARSMADAASRASASIDLGAPMSASAASERFSFLDPGSYNALANPRWWIAQGLPTVVELGVDLGLSAATGPAAPITFMALSGSKMAGDQYQGALKYYRERGDNEETAQMMAAGEGAVMGALGAALDRIPAGQFLTRNPAGKKILGRMIRNRIVREGLKGFTAESLPEMGQELASMLIAAGFRQDAKAFEDWDQQLSAAGLFGGVAGAKVGAFQGTMQSWEASAQKRAYKDLNARDRQLFEASKSLDALASFNEGREKPVTPAAISEMRKSIRTAKAGIALKMMALDGDVAGLDTGVEVDLPKAVADLNADPELLNLSVGVGAELKKSNPAMFGKFDASADGVRDALLVGRHAAAGVSSVASGGKIKLDLGNALESMGLLMKRPVMRDGQQVGTQWSVTPAGLAMLPRAERSKAANMDASGAAAAVDIVDNLSKSGDRAVAKITDPPPLPTKQRKILPLPNNPEGRAAAQNAAQAPASQSAAPEPTAADATPTPDEVPGVPQFVVTLQSEPDKEGFREFRETRAQGATPEAAQAAAARKMGPGWEPVRVQRATREYVEVAESDLSKSGKKAHKVASRVIQRNMEFLNALGISVRTVRYNSGVQTGGMGIGRDQVLTIDPEILSGMFAMDGGEQLFNEGIFEEVVHVAQYRAHGPGYKKVYEAIVDDVAKEMPEMLAKARATYNGFDNLQKWQQGAELERMVIQRKWRGRITEQLMKSLKAVLEYLTGLVESGVSSPMLGRSIEMVESVLADAGVINPYKGQDGGRSTQSGGTSASGKGGDSPVSPPVGEQGSQAGDPANAGVQTPTAQPPTGVGQPESAETTAQGGTVSLDPKSFVSGSGRRLTKKGRSAVEIAESGGDLAEFLRGDGEKLRPVGDGQLEVLIDYFEQSGNDAASQAVESEMGRRFRMEQEEEYAASQAEGRYELIEAVMKAGGLPTAGSTFQAELDDFRKGFKLAKRPGLFRKDAPDIDRVRGDLTSYGFRFDTADDLLTALDDRFRTGKPIYGNQFDADDEGQAFAAPVDVSVVQSYLESRGVPRSKLAEATNGVSRALQLAEDKQLAFDYEANAFELRDNRIAGSASNPQTPANQAAARRDVSKRAEAAKRRADERFAELERSALSGDLGALRRALNMRGRVSSLIKDLVSRKIPEFNIVGQKIQTAADFAAAARAFRSPYFESMKVAVLGADDTVTFSSIVHVGTLAESIASWRDVLQAVEPYRDSKGRARIIISHNHPSGDPTPSPADFAVHRRFQDLADLSDIHIFDNIVTNGRQFYSHSRDRTFDIPDGAQGSAIAKWERVARDSLKKISSSIDLDNVWSTISTDGAGAIHAVYVNTKLAIIGVERIDGAGAPAITGGRILRSASLEGAHGVFLDVSGLNDPQDSAAHVLNRMLKDSGVKVIDISGNRFGSYRANGLLEDVGNFSVVSEPIQLTGTQRKNLTRTYRRLSKMEREGTPLTPGQRRELENAERLLGQSFLFPELTGDESPQQLEPLLEQGQLFMSSIVRGIDPTTPPTAEELPGRTFIDPEQVAIGAITEDVDESDPETWPVNVSRRVWNQWIEAHDAGFDAEDYDTWTPFLPKKIADQLEEFDQLREAAADFVRDIPKSLESARESAKNTADEIRRAMKVIEARARENSKHVDRVMERLRDRVEAAMEEDSASISGQPEAEEYVSNLPVSQKLYRGADRVGDNADAEPGGIHWTPNEDYARQYARDNRTDGVVREGYLQPGRYLDFRRFGYKIPTQELLGVMQSLGVDINAPLQSWHDTRSIKEIAESWGGALDAADLEEEILRGAGHLLRQSGLDGAVFAEVGVMESPSILVFSEDSISDTPPSEEDAEQGQLFMAGVTPQQDREYLAAVERGDMDEAQILVMNALEAAGYDLAHRGSDPRTASDIVLFADLDGMEDRLASYGKSRYAAKRIDLQDVTKLPPSTKQWVIENYGKEWLAEMAPENIIESAQAWDDRQFASDLYQAQEYGMIPDVLGYATPDGAAVWPGFDKAVSADPIVRDANGNVIPLSQRFNPESDSILMMSSMLNFGPEGTQRINNQLELAFPVEAPQKPSVEMQGADAAQDKLVRANLGLAGKIATQFSNIPGIDSDDIGQEARSALARAARLFDANRGVPFGAFAGRVIRNHLLTLYKRQTGRPEGVSLDEPASGDGLTRMETTADTGAAAPEMSAADAERNAIVQDVVGSLPERQRIVIEGIMAGKTLEAIGAEDLDGVSKQAVHRIRSDAFKAIRSKLAARGLDQESLMMAPVDKSDLFGEWIAPTRYSPDVIAGYRGENSDGMADNNFGATEGHGVYIAKNRSGAEFFGKVRKVVFRRPKSPVLVDQDGGEEELPLLNEDSDVWNEILTYKVSPNDSPWIKAHKIAARKAGLTDATFGKRMDDFTRALTDALLQMGHDAVYVRSGGEEWVVLLAEEGRRLAPDSDGILMMAPTSPASQDSFTPALDKDIFGPLPTVGPPKLPTADDADAGAIIDGIAQRQEELTGDEKDLGAGNNEGIKDWYARMVRGRIDKLNHFAPGTGDIVTAMERDSAMFAAAMRRFNDSMQDRVQRSFGYPSWWRNRENRGRLKKFKNKLLPVAAFLNPTSMTDEGDFVFEAFWQRAGKLYSNQAQKMRREHGGNDWIGSDGFLYRIGSWIEPQKGEKEGYFQLERWIPQGTQHRTHEQFHDEFPEAAWLLDDFIRPGAENDRVVSPQGVVLPAFNRHALFGFYGETPQGEIERIPGYTPDIAVTRSIAGMAAHLLKLNWLSPARNYKTGEARERRKVKNLFEGFNTRAYEAHLETQRRKTAEELLKASARPIPDDGVPVGWVRLNRDVINPMIQSLRRSTGKAEEFFPDISGKITKRDLETLKAIFGDIDLADENMMIRKEVLGELQRGFVQREFENREMQMVNAWSREFKSSLLVAPFTFGTNKLSNLMFQVLRTFQTGAKAAASLAMLDPQQAKQSAIESISLAGLTLMPAFWIPQIKKKINEVIPPELFEGADQLHAYLGDSIDQPVADLLKQGRIPSAILKGFGYGDMDTHAKQKIALASLLGRAHVEADIAGVKGDARKQFIRDWIRKPSESAIREADAAAKLYAMDYANVPWWLDNGHPLIVGGVDMTAFGNLVRDNVLPFFKYPYNFARQVKRIGIDSVPKAFDPRTPKRERAEAIGNLAALSMFFALGWLMVKPWDEEDEDDILGRDYDETGREMEAKYRTSGRIRIAPSSISGRIIHTALKMFGAENPDEDYWLRTRTFPYASMMIATASAMDWVGDMASGKGASSRNMMNEAWAVTEDFMSMGSGARLGIALFGSRDQYDQGKTLPYMVGETSRDMVLGRFFPPQVMRDVRNLTDPIQRRSRPTESLKYGAGFVEGVLNGLPLASRVLPPTGQVTARARADGEPATQARMMLQAMGLDELAYREWIDPETGNLMASYVRPETIYDKPEWVTAIRQLALNIKSIPREEYEQAVQGDPEPIDID